MKDPLRTNAVTYIIPGELCVNNTCVQVAGQGAQTTLYTELFHNRGNMGWQFYSVLVLVAVLAAESLFSVFFFVFFFPILCFPSAGTIILYPSFL